jgi:hypothetical protein
MSGQVKQLWDGMAHGDAIACYFGMPAVKYFLFSPLYSKDTKTREANHFLVFLDVAMLTSIAAISMGSVARTSKPGAQF